MLSSPLRLGSGAIEVLKIIALATMLGDHINTVLWAREVDWLFALGRLTFPIFCLVMAYHYVHHPVRLGSWLKRLLLFAVITQPIYVWTMQDWGGNVFFTLLLGLLAIAVWDRRRRYGVYAWAILAIIAAVASVVDYHQSGVLAVPLLVLWWRQGGDWLLFLVIVNFLAANFFLPLAAMTMLVWAIVALLAWRAPILPRLPKYFYYGFYPAHFVVLKLIALQFGM
jgi:hypothetical protein